MPYQVKISPSNRTFIVEEGEPVLEAALRQGYSLPHGCRDGACGSCKGKILEGEVDYGNYQPSALSETEKLSGLALFCQAKPKHNLVIECREISAIKDIQIKTLPARVQKLEKLAPDVMAIFLKLPANERLQFLAGQYIDILLKAGRRRSLSLANSPDQNEYLELHMRNVQGGYFSQHVFTHMKERDILRIRGPLGSFFLRDDNAKPAIFVAGGTGFAPIKSMIQHALSTGPNRELILYWGARARVDLYQNELPDIWQREHVNFRFIPVLSEPQTHDDWLRRTGLVHRAVMDDFASLTNYQVYVCGAPAMVDIAQQEFTRERGLLAEEFFSDAFTFSSDPQTATKTA